MDRLGTDEEAIKKALGYVRNPQDYKMLDQAFKDLEDNDDKESIEKWVTSELGNQNDLEKYYYSELRRIKLPHKIKIVKKRGKPVVPQGYDEKGNFIIKKGSNAK